MTLTSEVPEDLALRLQTAGIQAEDASRYAVAALAEVADQAEVRLWWDERDAEERSAEVRTTRDSVAAADEGRVSPAAEVYARVRSHSASKVRV